MHVILLGDSIFDNAAYVQRGEPDVRAQLAKKLGESVTLLAVDGDTTQDMPRQIAKIPGDATHLILSIGGNDALGNIHLLDMPVTSSAETIMQMAMVQSSFEKRYRQTVQTLLKFNLPLALCIIYNPNFPDMTFQELAKTALSIFNDVVIGLGIEYGLPMIDLRAVCSEDSDYANPIEPSAKGGDKITVAIVHVLEQHDFTRKRSEIFIK